MADGSPAHEQNAMPARSAEIFLPASITEAIKSFFRVAEQRAVGMLTLMEPQTVDWESKIGAPTIKAPATVSSSFNE